MTNSAVLPDGSMLNEGSYTSVNKTKPLPIKQSAAAYVITIKGIAAGAGQVCLAKCRERGLQGQLVNELRQGREVILEGGVVVKPEEVLEEAVPGIKCLVVDCPSKHFMRSLTTNKTILRLKKHKPVVPFVFHFTPAKVHYIRGFLKSMQYNYGIFAVVDCQE